MADRRWALILGASSGFGAAACRRLATAGFNIFGVHLDRRGTLGLVDEVRSAIESAGGKAVFFNVNAADEEKRAEIIAEIKRTLGTRPPSPPVHVLLHSLAFGTLKPFVGAAAPGDEISKPQMDMTLEVMAHTLVYWTQALFRERLLAKGSKVFAMTSSGGERVFPFYGAVSASKAALESHIRQLALELAPHGISANSIRAGVTDTPALRKIPGHERLIAEATRKNPSGRLTKPEDVAEAIAAISLADTHWLTGNVIGVDGGENIVD
jgi:NAD(P)-dependent dehydrogenase (short-subunit alcohol dehydrogenase family)